MEFNYHLPVNLIFGRNSVCKLKEISADYGKKALIVTGKNSTKKSGLLDRVIGYLDKAGVDVFRTDRDGAILLEDENGKMILRTADDF